jgi:predicted TPR repeat methyltransferase
MTPSPLPKPEIPEAHAAELSVRAWAAEEAVLGTLLASGLNTAQAAARFGLHLMKENQLQDAATVFRAAIALAPKEPDLWTNLGVALDRLNQSGEAAAALEQSVSLSVQQPDLWIFLGVVRGKLGDLLGAEGAYRTALAQAPTSIAGWQCLGLLKENERDFLAAIDCLRTCERLGAGSAAISANLGKLYYQLGRVQEAHDAYAAAVREAPDNPHYQRMLGKARFLSDAIAGRPIDEALAGYQLDSQSNEDQLKERLAWLEIAAGLLTGLGHRDAAIRLLKKQIELAPDSASAKYLLDAVSGEQLSSIPRDYIVESFDAFAERFDAQLVGVLGYDAPEKLCAQIVASAQVRAPGNKQLGEKFAALDAGCGTGLCGPLLRKAASRLIGVDLAPKMLAQAQLKNIYDALDCADLTEWLNAHPAELDVIVAADVLLYFGDLSALFAGAAAALRPNGIFSFSTEVEAGLGPDGYRVLPSGRFAHDPDYVRGVARAGFEQELCVETTLRLDAKGRVRGNLFLFRRRAA